MCLGTEYIVQKLLMFSIVNYIKYLVFHVIGGSKFDRSANFSIQILLKLVSFSLFRLCVWSINLYHCNFEWHVLVYVLDCRQAQFCNPLFDDEGYSISFAEFVSITEYLYFIQK